MNILDKIIQQKKLEVEQRKSQLSIAELKNFPHFSRNIFSLQESLENKNGIIAEFKRQSPSKGIINDKVEVKDTVIGYQKANVSAVSILTDHSFFGGSFDDLIEARNSISIPILRKDFMIDTYQLYEAKAYGADAVLLIAEALTKEQVKTLSSKANDLDLEVLLEIHSKEQLSKATENVTHIGVNNRNLKTFTVDVSTSEDILRLIPSQYGAISESGISNVDTVKHLSKLGFNGFLIGENFMKQENPAKTCLQFCNQL